MEPIVVTAIAVFVTAAVTAPTVWKIAISNRIKNYESKVGTAEERAREIIEKANLEAETKKREALLEAKEESLKAKNEFERESKERRTELQKYEKRVLTKEEATDRKSEALEKREIKLNEREAELEKGKKDVEELHSKQKIISLKLSKMMLSTKWRLWSKILKTEQKKTRIKRLRKLLFLLSSAVLLTISLRLLYLWYSFLMMR